MYKIKRKKNFLTLMREAEKIFILENENQFAHVFQHTVSVRHPKKIASLHVFS